MDWNRFISFIKGLGYEGNPEDFAAVVRWLKTNGHDTDSATDADGATYELKALYDERPGKPLDVTTAVKAAAEDERIQAAVEARLEEFTASTGLAVNGRKRHTVEVKARTSDDPTGGFGERGFGTFCKAVVAACNKSNPVVSDTLEIWQKASLSTYGAESPGADGGFAVPPQFREAIVSRVMGEDSILSRCDQIPMSSNMISFPEDETTPWQTSGGILAFWEGEAGTFTQSKPALKLKELRPRKVTALVPVTEELLEDSTAMGAYVSRKAGEKIDFKVGEAIFRGTGAGQPLGFLNGGSKISVTKETNQVADTLTGPNIIKMWSRMYGPWRRNAVWFINQDTEPELMRLSLSGRTDSGGAVSGFGGLLYMPAGGLSASPFPTLLGRPVISTQHCATVGDEGDIILADMQQYAAGIRGGLESQSSIHLWFDQDAVAFKFRMRIDGMPWMSTAISARASGSPTMSAFITLAARA
jgi:HK97 family phage major capsid protein